MKWLIFLIPLAGCVILPIPSKNGPLMCCIAATEYHGTLASLSINQPDQSLILKLSRKF